MARSIAQKLSERVVHDPAAMKQLEQIVHPMLGAGRQKFFEDAERAGAPVVVVDVPLAVSKPAAKSASTRWWW